VSATGLDHDLDEDFRFSPGTHSVLGWRMIVRTQS
jgi:hypothetical protein